MPDPERRCPKCGAPYGGEVLFCPADGTPLTSRPVAADVERFVGRTVYGDVTVEALLGVGAMASVFLGRQLGVERSVAVKILHGDLSRDALLVARFRREARAAARIRHPNVVEVIGAGDLAPDETDAPPQPYLVLEHLDGLTLRSALSASDGALPLERALEIALQLCDAVGEAHELGIVHRDIKPENVMLVRRGDQPDFVKLLDFGLSRLGEADPGIATHAGAVLGTARYLSPEGARGEAVGAPADVYAIATILFECLAGRTPFEGDRPVAILVQKSSQPAPELGSFPRGRSVPEPIAALLSRALARDPAQRPEHGRALGQALVRAAAESGCAPAPRFLRSASFGASASARPLKAAPTQVLGSPSPELLTRTSNHVAGASTSAPSRVFGRVGVVVVCFALGALGALGLATHVGGCGGGVP